MAISSYFVDPSLDDTSGTGVVGDPWGDLQHALDTITQNTTDGDQINVKAGTDELLTAALDLTTYGTTATAYRLHIRGYTSAANDGGIGGISGDGSYSTFAVTGTNYISLTDMHLHNSGANDVIRLNDSVYFENCEIDNGSDGIYIDDESIVINCFIHNIDNYGIKVSAASLVYGNSVRDLAGDTYSMTYGISLQGIGSYAVNNIIIVGHTNMRGIDTVYGDIGILNNTVYSSVAATTEGIKSITQNAGTIIANNYVEGFIGAGGDGIYVPSTAIVNTVRNNRAYNCTTAFTTDGAIYATDNSVVGSSALTDPGSGDFSVGTDLKAGAYPSTFKGISTDQFMDIGAAQREEPAGGGGGRRARIRAHGV